jgi:methionine synthase II (cobalamin-independent)
MTQARRNPPFRAEHLGSLLRPKELLEARAAAAKGEDKDNKVAKITDDSIKEVVDLQRKLGFHAMTDGEYR